MIAIQIRVNGGIIFTVDEDDWQSLHAILSLKSEVRRQAPSFELNVGGTCKAEDPCRGDSIRWETQYLNKNDEVSLKIIETEYVDKPIARLKRKELEVKYDPQFMEEELEKMDLF